MQEFVTKLLKIIVSYVKLVKTKQISYLHVVTSLARVPHVLPPWNSISNMSFFQRFF